MKLFIESASLEAVEDAVDVGLCDGVVVGVELSRAGGKALRKLVDALVTREVGPVVIEVTPGSTDEMLARARELGALGDDVVAGLPMSRDGLAAAQVCFDEGIATRVATCFSTAQALLAAKAGATWIACDVGLVDDAGGDGVKLAEDIASMLSTCDFETQLVGAGVRHAQHVGELALVGVHAVTLGPELLWQLVSHPLSDAQLASTGRPADAAPRARRR